ncbi:hypothetical protein XENOCAPTIV_005653, partial [Xenoophorus captivus]
ELKGKFLIKGKRLNKLDAMFSNNNTVEEEMVSEEDEAQDCKEKDQKAKPKKAKIKLAKELSDIVIYCKSVHFSGFEHSRDNQAFYEMSSFKESKALNLSETSDNDIKETHYIKNNGFNPVWNEKFEFAIHVPELALVRFMLEDYDSASQNDFIGQYCLPLTSVQNGYRQVPLLTKRGDIIPSAELFVHTMLLDCL